MRLMSPIAGVIALILLAIGLILYSNAPSFAVDDKVQTVFNSVVDKSGKISLPAEDYRSNWHLLGSWSIAGSEGAEGIHNVYTQPGVIEAFQNTGEFPDGAVLLKELLSAKTGEYSTGTVSYADELQGFFVMVKDENKRNRLEFKGNKLWGDGWGWAYFDASDRENSTTVNYKMECKSCHVPARKTDWIFTEAYPVLRKK
jgi:hypothetical protein